MSRICFGGKKTWGLVICVALVATPVLADRPADGRESGPGLRALAQWVLSAVWGASDNGPIMDPNGLAAPGGTRSSGPVHHADGDNGPIMDPDGLAAPGGNRASGSVYHVDGDNGPIMDPNG